MTQALDARKHATERRLPEPGKNPYRTPFERDRARLLHSSALRRMGAKTQVLGPSTDDFVRTRLTHTLEVAQVGRELGKVLGCDPDVVETACLAHDLGHPPFGHNGERALAEVTEGQGGFEGNAQTLRLLTHLEPKVMGEDGTSYGLNLTRASLDATVKYPWPQGGAPASVGKTRKYGVYPQDLAAFEWVRDGAPVVRQCVEAQVMDFADDVGYSVHDVEDAIASGSLDPAVLHGDAGDVTLSKIVSSTLGWYRGADAGEDELADAARRLAEMPQWLTGFNGSRRDLAALKNLTSQLIGRFCGAVEIATRAVTGPGALQRYDADLVIPRDTQVEILLLKGLAVHYVMGPREYEADYLRERTIIFDLVDALREAGPSALEPPYAEDYLAADGDESARLRAIVDQVASLTDHSAQLWHARMCGMFSELY